MADTCTLGTILYMSSPTCTDLSESERLYLPELLHNIQLLVDHTEQDILHSNRKLHYNQDLLVNLRHEREGLEKEVEEEQTQIEKLSGILYFEVVET